MQAIAAPPPMLARLRPSINQAMVVTMAVIWEEAIDGVAEHTDLHAVLAHFAHSLFVTILCVAFKCATSLAGAVGILFCQQQLPKTKLLELVTTTFQTLTGWMWKAVLNEFIDLAHEPVAGGSVPVGGGAMWGCTGVSLGFAVATTLAGVAILRLLPLLKAPAAGSSGFSGSALAFHVVGTLCGAVTLPMAFAWHYVIFNGATSVVAPGFADPASTLGAVGRWLLYALVLLLCTLLVLAALGSLRMAVTPRLARAKEAKAIPEGRVKRYEAAFLKVLDFLLAWMIFAILQSSHQPIDRSACFPDLTPHAIEGGGPELAIVLTLVILLAVVSVVMLKAHLGAKADAKAASLAPAAAPLTRMGAHAWAICLGTLGIMLGWAVKDFYDAVLDAILTAAASSAQTKTGVHGGVLGAIVFTLAALAGHACASGGCAPPKTPTAPAPVNVPTAVTQQTKSVAV